MSLMDTSADVSATRRFLEAHEKLEADYETALKTIDDLTNQCAQLKDRGDTMEELNAKERAQSRKWLRYAVAMASQVQFMVAGGARALQISDEVTREIEANDLHKDDVAEIERIIATRPQGKFPDWKPGDPPAIASSNTSPATANLQAEPLKI